MIAPADFVEQLEREGVEFFCGVPDSLLKDLCSFVERTVPSRRHVITANEGSAVAIATGHHLATGKVPVVYMQNSGFGNAINPLLSLADVDVYSIPMVVIVGWRGEPGVRDEPQHVVQGRVMEQMLDAMALPYLTVSPAMEKAEASSMAASAVTLAVERSGPVVILVKKGTFESDTAMRPAGLLQLSRERAIELVLDAVGPGTTIVASTGHISREVFALRASADAPSLHADFLTVGSMGHASQIALGLMLGEVPKVVCLDGDGALLMHLGGLITLGRLAAGDYTHILLNNGVHDSVGGQPTGALGIALVDASRALGFAYALGPALDEIALTAALAERGSLRGPTFIEVQVCPGGRDDLPRPKAHPREAKAAFMTRLSAASREESRR
jgi:phosphonopyruvate decarboxylase